MKTYKKKGEFRMKLGIHAYAWCSVWSNETLDLIDRTKSLGLDFIEIPLMRLELFDSQAVSKRLEGAGINSSTSTVLLEGMDISSPDKNERQKGIKYLKDCVQATSEIGAKHMCGVIYSQHVIKANQRPGAEVWDRAAEGLHEVAMFARTHDVMIGLEPVNRYETYLINTAEQAMMLIDMIGLDNVGVHLDTYHMNIEEKSFYDAVKTSGDKLIHVHLCENDRGIPGTGLVNWNDLFKALKDINYEGYTSLESFVDVTDNMNTWVWRQLAEDGDTLVSQGKNFIRSMQLKYQLL
jgi:D-psicose/D-tagatose/L-ribulose 3-epimerase